jgi:hypothetical protein
LPPWLFVLAFLKPRGSLSGAAGYKRSLAFVGRPLDWCF